MLDNKKANITGLNEVGRVDLRLDNCIIMWIIDGWIIEVLLYLLLKLV